MTRFNVVFEPQPGSQSLALSCPCDEILYEGTRGPGKTAAQLMRFRQKVGLGYGSYWKGVIFDIEYKNLSDIIAQSKKLFYKFKDGAKFYKDKSELKWTWPTGEELLFRHEKDASGYWNYHGQELPFIGYNELTKRADGDFYELMFSCLRSSFRPKDHPRADGSLLPPIPLECFSTTNPFGVGHSWVKKHFIDPAPRGTVQRREIKIINPRTDIEETITLTRVAIHGSWRENKYLDLKYIAWLMSIKDPNKRKAWVDGDWSVTAGGRFDHLWNEAIHTVPPFQIPESWIVDRSHDWGESKPFANLWFAESNGDECELGNYPPGTLFVIGEFYGCEPDQHNKGLNMSASNVAKVVAQVDAALADEHATIDFDRGQINITPGIAPQGVEPGPADNAINDGKNALSDTDEDKISIADKMADQGVEWTRSDKSPGSRITGAAVLCELLEAAVEGHASQSGKPERPALYFFNNVRGIIARFPILARDSKKPDDVDTKQEDHDYDALRYRATINSRREVAISIKRY